MRLELTCTGVARATLSKRNALTLLHQLDRRGSSRWLESNDVSADGAACWERTLMVRCHEDGAPAADGSRGDIVSWAEGATFVVDCSRSALGRLAEVAGDAEAGAVRSGRLELRAESDELHYGDRLAAPGLLEDETEQHLMRTCGHPVRPPEQLGPVTTILFRRPAQ